MKRTNQIKTTKNIIRDSKEIGYVSPMKWKKTKQKKNKKILKIKPECCKQGNLLGFVVETSAAESAACV